MYDVCLDDCIANSTTASMPEVKILIKPLDKVLPVMFSNQMELSFSMIMLFCVVTTVDE